MAAALALLVLWRIALVAEAGDDPLKTWLYSLQLHFPDSDDKSTEEGGTTRITTHDVECHNVKFDRIRTSEGYLLGDPGLDVYVSGLQLECSGKWKTTGTVSWLVVGDGTITAKLKGDNGARFKAEVKRHWGPIGWIKNARCDMELHFDVSLAGGLAVMVANVIQRMFSPYVSSYLETQIQTKACAAFDELLKEKLHKPIKFLNNLFYPPYSRWLPPPVTLRGDPAEDLPPVPMAEDIARFLAEGEPEENSSDEPAADTNRSASDAVPKDHKVYPKLEDWTASGLIEWGQWLATQAMPPEVVRKLAKLAMQGDKSLSIDLTELKMPSKSVVIDQHDTAGLRLSVDVTPVELILDGLEGVQAYGVEAISPTQVQVNTEFGHEEDPATGLTVKFALHVTAADTTKSNAPVASMHQEIGFSLALLRPKGGFQMRLPCRAEMLRASRTLGQWFMDPLNCGRSLLAETPTLEELNISFDGLARPLRYIPFTGGDLEQDISNLFNHLVNIFNRIYQDRLPGAMARLATSDRGLNFVNTLLAHHMSPAQCMNAAEAEEAIAGMFPATFSDWPKVLDGQMHGYLDRIIEGVLRQNQTTAPEGWLQMPPLTIGALSDVHLKDLRLTGTSQISKLQLMQTNTAEKEMLGFDLEAACPNDQKPFPTLLEMTWGGTLDVGSEVLVQVQMPCGSLQASLNVSVDTIDTADILVPPSIFCTLLTPFQTLAVTSLEAVKQGPGALYVTLGSAPKVDVVEEMCKLYPKLCVFGSRLGEHLAHPGNATDLLSFLHKAAVKHCDALQVVTGRRLQEEKTRDEKGIPYDEGFNALLWIASLLGSLALAAGVTYLVAWKAGHSVNTRRSSLALHVFVGSRPGRGFIFVVSFLMFISLCLRLIATQTLPYVSMEMAMVYKPSGREIDSQTLGVFTFWGLGFQFRDGAGFFLFMEWIINGPVVNFMAVGCFLMAWLFPLSFRVQHCLLRVGLFSARRSWQEAATLGNSALSVNANLLMPLEMEQQLRMNMLYGPVVAMGATVCVTLAGLCMLLSLPLRSEGFSGPREGESRLWVLPELALCSGIVVGMVIWLCFDFVEVEFRGLAGLLLEKQSFKGGQVGDGDPALKCIILCIFVFAPLTQALCVMARAMELKLPKDRLRQLEEVAMGFNCLDIFMLAYFMGFLNGVDGFTSSYIDTKFDTLCSTSMFLGESCIGVDARPADFGTLGLGMAAVCTLLLYIRSSVQYHYTVSAPARSDEESGRAVELQ